MNIKNKLSIETDPVDSRMRLSGEFKLVFGSLSALIFFALISWPLNHLPSKEAKLYTTVGKPNFTNGSKRSGDIKLAVNGKSIICTNPSFYSGSRCEYLKKIVEPNQFVKVVFFQSRGVLGMKYFVLQSLEQNGKLLLSSTETQELQMRYYKKQVQTNSYMLIFYTVIFLFIFFNRKKMTK